MMLLLWNRVLKIHPVSQQLRPTKICSNISTLVIRETDHLQVWIFLPSASTSSSRPSSSSSEGDADNEQLEPRPLK